MPEMNGEYKRFLCIFFAVMVVGSQGQNQQSNGDKWSASNPLYIHVIPHSHCDPGWLKTYFEYYSGHVNRILTGVTNALIADPKKTFIWAEVSFFKLWWESQSIETKEAVRRVVANGQLEFVGGGWVQNDEAASPVEVVLNQISEGHEYLLRQFNFVPTIAWQVDPFGHSSLTPTLFSQIGYKALVINRIHHHLKQIYKESRDMEFIWRASPSLSSKAEMFTHVLHTHYAAPKTFDWEEDAVAVSDTNIQYRASYFVSSLKERAQAYRTNQLLVPWGDDFKFQNSDVQFNNMDKLISHINSNPEVYGARVEYSTLGKYFEAVREFLGSDQGQEVSFSTYYGDFFPYADNEDSYWTGYYTTRPLLKGYLRETLSVLRSAEMLYALGRASSQHLSSFSWDLHWDNLRDARRDSALVAHHDGVTGTSRARVVDDYMSKLHLAHSNGEATVAACTGLLLAKEAIPEFNKPFNFFDMSKDISYPLAFHNSLGWKRSQVVTLRVNSANVQVLDYEGKPIVVEVFPVWEKEESGIKLESELDTFDLVFQVEVPPAGLATYFLTSSLQGVSRAPYTVYLKDYLSPLHGKMKNVKQLGTSEVFIENKFLKVTFGSSGELESIVDKTTGERKSLKAEYFSYTSMRSGAYIFRSDQRAAAKVPVTGLKLHVIKGNVLQQAVIYAKIHQTVRLLNTDDPQYGKVLEFVHEVSPTGHNTELVIRYSTEMTNSTLWVDNGLELRPKTIRRLPDIKPEANYFPVQTTAALREQESSFTVLVRQPAGVTSDTRGRLEMALHRRLEQDDGRGLAEAVQDDTRIMQPHWILYTDIEENNRRRHQLSLMLEHPLRMSVASTSLTFDDWAQKYNGIFTPLTAPLPPNLHLFSLRSRDSTSDEVVLRFNHLFESMEHETLSTPATVDLQALFATLDLSALRQVSLSLNNEPRDMYRVHYPSGDQELLPLGGISVAPKLVSGDKQNSDEEGVFLSKIALEEAKKNKTKNKDRQNSDEEGVFLSKIALENANTSNSASKARKLLDYVGRLPLSLRPIEMAAFLTLLEPKDFIHYRYKPDELGELDKAPPVRVPVRDEVITPRTKGKAKEAVSSQAGRNAPIVGIEPGKSENLSGREVRTLLFMTSLGILLILGVFLKLQTRKTRVAKEK